MANDIKQRRGVGFVFLLERIVHFYRLVHMCSARCASLDRRTRGDLGVWFAVLLPRCASTSRGPHAHKNAPNDEKLDVVQLFPPCTRKLPKQFSLCLPPYRCGHPCRRPYCNNRGSSCQVRGKSWEEKGANAKESSVGIITLFPTHFKP